MVKKLILFPDLDKFRPRQWPLHATLCKPYAERHHPFRLRVWQRTQQNGVDDAEDRRVRADAECECENGDESEYSVFSEHSHAITQVLNHLVLPSLWLQAERVPEGAQTSPQQFKFVA